MKTESTISASHLPTNYKASRTCLFLHNTFTRDEITVAFGFWRKHFTLGLQVVPKRPSNVCDTWRRCTVGQFYKSGNAKKIKLLLLIGWESKAFKQKSSCSIKLIVVAPLITFISWRWHSCNLFQSIVKTRIASNCQSQDRGEKCPVWQDYSSTCMQSKVLW